MHIFQFKWTLFFFRKIIKCTFNDKKKSAYRISQYIVIMSMLGKDAASLSSARMRLWNTSFKNTSSSQLLFSNRVHRVRLVPISQASNHCTLLSLFYFFWSLKENKQGRLLFYICFSKHSLRCKYPHSSSHILSALTVNVAVQQNEKQCICSLHWSEGGKERALFSCCSVCFSNDEKQRSVNVERKVANVRDTKMKTF